MQSIIHRSENKKTECVESDHDKAFLLLVKAISEDLFKRHGVFDAAELITI